MKGSYDFDPGVFLTKSPGGARQVLSLPLQAQSELRTITGERSACVTGRPGLQGAARPGQRDHL